jgi:hypothetical protein
MNVFIVILIIIIVGGVTYATQNKTPNSSKSDNLEKLKNIVSRIPKAFRFVILAVLFLAFLFWLTTCVFFQEKVRDKAKPSGANIGKTGRDFTSGLYNGLSGNIVPSTLLISEIQPQKKGNDLMITLEPNKKTFVHVPDKQILVGSPTRLYFSPIGTDEIYEYPTSAEYLATGIGASLPPGDYYVFSKAVETFSFTITY